MELSKAEVAKLRQLVAACERILAKADQGAGTKAAKQAATKPKRTRRSGKELAAFRKMLISERKRGVPVAELAAKHGISTAYIYML